MVNEVSGDDLFAIPDRSGRERQLQQRGGMAEEMADCYGPAHARARRTDPDTSHKAAAAIDPHVATVRQAVEHYAKQAGPGGFTDEELSAHFKSEAQSTHRTRRSELTDENIVLDSGRRVRNSGQREVIVWVHREFVAQPPAIRAPKAKVPPDQVAAAFGTLERWAKQMRNEGRLFSHEIDDAVRTLKEAR